MILNGGYFYSRLLFISKKKESKIIMNQRYYLHQACFFSVLGVFIYTIIYINFQCTYYKKTLTALNLGVPITNLWGYFIKVLRHVHTLFKMLNPVLSVQRPSPISWCLKDILQSINVSVYKRLLSMFWLTCKTFVNLISVDDYCIQICINPYPAWTESDQPLPPV